MPGPCAPCSPKVPAHSTVAPSSRLFTLTCPGGPVVKHAPCSARDVASALERLRFRPKRRSRVPHQDPVQPNNFFFLEGELLTACSLSYWNYGGGLALSLAEVNVTCGETWWPALCLWKFSCYPLGNALCSFCSLEVINDTTNLNRNREKDPPSSSLHPGGLVLE